MQKIMKQSRYMVIMAGGVGSRFWPSSTEKNPKQFLDILNIGKSLIRITYERCLQVVPNQNILVVTNKQYKDLVKVHLPELPEENVLCEPSRNNTAPCVAFTSLHLTAKNRQAVFSMVPSDHVIEKESVFKDKLNEAFEIAESEPDAIVTLGIRPTRPDTGYGYIKMAAKYRSAFEVEAFKEKPDQATAEKYFESGDYLWNAGMFVWSVSTIVDAFKKYEPQIIETLSEDISCFGTNREQDYIDRVYPQTKSISVDYAILERAQKVYTIPADIGWSDLGTWNSLHAYLEKDTNGNVVQSHSQYLDDVSNSLIVAQKERTIVIKGLDNFIVVDEPGALLIYPKDKEQEIKQVVKKLEEDK
jgi:mannose-1-phosphate guanylyltransferase